MKIDRKENTHLTLAERETERERDRERQRETETDRDRQTEREREQNIYMCMPVCMYICLSYQSTPSLPCTKHIQTSNEPKHILFYQVYYFYGVISTSQCISTFLQYCRGGKKKQAFPTVFLRQANIHTDRQTDRHRHLPCRLEK